LSTVLDDYSRYIIAWKLCITMKAEDVTDTLGLRCRRQAVIRPRFTASRACYPTMVRVTYPVTWQNGWIGTLCNTSAARPTTRRP
jgi:transposase InsO family protein